MVIVYLGATIIHKPNGHDHYVWTDKSRLNFLTDIVETYEPGAGIYKPGSGLSRRIEFPYADGSGKCVTLIYFSPVLEGRAVSIPCNVSLNVSLYCSFNEKSTDGYNTRLSTFDIGFAGNFRTVNKRQYCSNNKTDYLNGHWFQQDDICLRLSVFAIWPLYQISQMPCETLQEVCKPYDLYKISAITQMHPSTLYTNSNVGKYLSLFRARYRSSGKSSRKKLIPICLQQESSSRLPELFLSIPVQDYGFGLWAIQGNIDITHRDQLTGSFTENPVLCTKESLVPDKPTCHSSYFRCYDDTCLDDQLVCDGRQHCLSGEDEANCTHICTHSVNCASKCSYMKNCHCSRGYFQCQSGGCISVRKLCDGVHNCKDSSDEPKFCDIKSANIQRTKLEEHWQSHLILGINGFICSDDGANWFRNNLPHYSLDYWCFYNYSWFSDIGYAHFPCANGYHLSRCENMHCIDTFKCIRSYCVEWKYLCDDICDCPHCEDESICENVSCPGMILHESAHGKVYCNEQADSRLAAVMIQSSSYDVHTHAQLEMCAQMFNCSGTTTTWSNIVYLDLLHGDHLVDHEHVTLEMMEFIIYCNITHYNIGDEDAEYLKNLVVVQYLDLSHNNIRDYIYVSFRKMTQLLYLDLSSNQLSHLGKSFLSVFPNLKYLFLQNNKIAFAHNQISEFIKSLNVVFLQGNALRSRSLQLDLLQMKSSLTNLSSDLPRLCCAVPTETQCSPQFTMFVTCRDMIHSQFHVYLTWIIMILTSFCNISCIIILTVNFCMRQCIRSRLAKQPLFVIILFNITLANMIVSVCLLSLSVYNWHYQGVFGIYADVWRQSVACYTLELSLFVCTECSLIFSVYLAAVSHNQITSLVKQSHSMKKYLSIVASVWISMLLLGICKLVIWEYFQANDFNYFCLPFQMIKIESYVTVGMQTGIMSVDVLLIGIFILIEVFILRYLSTHAKETSGVLKPRINYKKIAIRISCLIMSNV